MKRITLEFGSATTKTGFDAGGLGDHHGFLFVNKLIRKDSVVNVFLDDQVAGMYPIYMNKKVLQVFITDGALEVRFDKTYEPSFIQRVVVLVE